MKVSVILAHPDRERKILGDPLETLWKNCIFKLCGVNKFYRRMFSTIVTSTEHERKQWLDEVKEIINTNIK